MKKIIIAVLALATFTLSAKPKPDVTTGFIRINYSGKNMLGMSTEILDKSNQKILFGFDYMFDLKNADGINFKDNSSFGGKIGLETYPKLYIGGKVGFGSRTPSDPVLVQKIEKYTSSGYGYQTSSSTTIQETYSERSPDLMTYVGAFIIYNSKFSPSISFDTYSGVSVGIGIKLK